MTDGAPIQRAEATSLCTAVRAGNGARGATVLSASHRAETTCYDPTDTALAQAGQKSRVKNYSFFLAPSQAGMTYSNKDTTGKSECHQVRVHRTAIY